MLYYKKHVNCHNIQTKTQADFMRRTNAGQTYQSLKILQKDISPLLTSFTILKCYQIIHYNKKCNVWTLNTDER